MGNFVIEPSYLKPSPPHQSVSLSNPTTTYPSLLFMTHANSHSTSTLFFTNNSQIKDRLDTITFDKEAKKSQISVLHLSPTTSYYPKLVTLLYRLVEIIL